MRKRLLLQMALWAALALLMAACRNAHPQTDGDGLRAQEAEAIEDSGRHLGGEFVAQSAADDYEAGRVQGAPHWTFSFRDDGAFRSEREVRGVKRVEEGSYLISTPGELVLYIERVAGEALADARPERYRIEAESPTELKLRRDGAATLVLRKQ